VALGLAGAMALALAACEPSPSYPPAEQPLVGRIVEEQSKIVDASWRQFQLDSIQGWGNIHIDLPEGAYPVGTLVTVRLVTDLKMQSDTPLALDGLVYYRRAAFEAIQLLPSDRAPAVAMSVGIDGDGRTGPYELLHAREGDLAWTLVGTIQKTTPITLVFDIDASGLWSLGQMPAGAEGAPDGGRD
jgi:hypothetical protein